MFQQLIPVVLLATTLAQPDAESLTGVARSWDFESQDDVDYDGWPDDWRRRRGKGYPLYVDIGIEPTDSRVEPTDGTGDVVGSPPPNHALQLELDGNAAMVFSPRVPVTAVFSYLLTGRVKTEGLIHNVAEAEIRFYDAKRKLLSTHKSDEFSGTTEWTNFRIEPVTPDAEAESAIIALHLHPTTSADLRGAAWFDDLRVVNLPRVVLGTNDAHNLYTDPDDIEVTCQVSGFRGAAPTVSFELLDVDDRVLAAKQRTMSSVESGVDGIFSGSTSWAPPVPGPGFYQVRVRLPGSKDVEIERPVKLAVLADLGDAGPGQFGWAFPNADQELPLSVLVELLPEVGVHWVKFPVWHGRDEPERGSKLGWFAERLAAHHIQLVGMLDHPPSETREMFSDKADLPVASVFTEPEIWKPAVEPVLQSLSLRVRWWQLGGDRDTSFVNFPDLAKTFAGIHDEFTRFGNKVNLGMVWPTIKQAPDVEARPWSFLQHIEEPSLTADELLLNLTAWADDETTHWCELQPLARDGYSLETRVRDLVSRMLAAKIGQAKAAFVPRPFDDRRGLISADGEPDQLLLPWRTTATVLGGARYQGRMTLPNRSPNHLFQRGEDSVLVVWNHSPIRESIYLGDDVRQVDLWGRTKRLDTEVVNGVVRQVIDVGPLPTFLVGLNPLLAEWRTRFQLTTKKLASVFGRRQSVRYELFNPIDQGVGGMISIHTPEVWNTERASARFKLSANETRELNFDVALKSNANSGEQPLRVDFDITTDRTYRFSVYRSLHVGLGDIEIDVETRLDQHGNLIVEQHLINNTDKSVSFNCLLFAPNRRRERRQIFHAKRGRTENIFVLANGRELLGKALWLRAEEIDGVRVLNQHIQVHE